jgi:hypothetical protein
MSLCIIIDSTYVSEESAASVLRVDVNDCHNIWPYILQKGPLDL